MGIVLNLGHIQTFCVFLVVAGVQSLCCSGGGFWVGFDFFFSRVSCHSWVLLRKAAKVAAPPKPSEAGSRLRCEQCYSQIWKSQIQEMWIRSSMITGYNCSHVFNNDSAQKTRRQPDLLLGAIRYVTGLGSCFHPTTTPMLQ